MQLKIQFFHERWFQILVVGIVLFFVFEQVLISSGNNGYVLPVIWLGAFTVPAAYVAYFCGQERQLDRAIHRTSPMISVLDCFLIGGALGVIVAGLIEVATLRTLSIPSLFSVGLIEESAKLVVPVLLFWRWRYRSEADGLLFGVATGMGFAALETMGYGIQALVVSHGSLDAANQTLLVRGLLSPFGHATWTGLVCSALWRERARTGKLLNGTVVGMFVLAIVLHASWDIVGGFGHLWAALVGFVVVASISVALLVREIRGTRRSGLSGGPLSMPDLPV
jgi:protease PrsW